MQKMITLIWNTEWAKADSKRGRYIADYAKASKVDLVCYTEATKGMYPTNGHVIESEADYGYKKTEGRRKVILWSKTPWTNVDIQSSSTFPSGRFVSGYTQGVFVIGVCIPWKDAHVSTGRKDKKPWEDHLDYLSRLHEIIKLKCSEYDKVVIIGDFNQRVPKGYQPQYVYDALEAAFKDQVTIRTQNITDSEGKLLIDHVATSNNLNVDVTEIHPKVTKDELRLSDHVGVLAHISDREGVSETVKDRIHECYANLAMAHAAVEDESTKYGPKHFMIRARLKKGLKEETMKIRSLFFDEKVKMKSIGCSYCGSEDSLSVDHLIPRYKGGEDTGDNLIPACKSCNSSKNKKDLILWYLNHKEEFPPLRILRRYLKLLLQYCTEKDLLDKDINDPLLKTAPFVFSDLPIQFPQPEYLYLSGQANMKSKSLD